MFIEDLPTPAVLIEKSRLERNIRRMQEKADATGVALRPHIKTHKSVRIGREQMTCGAMGIAVAKPSEAEVFANAGFENIRIAYSIYGEGRWQQVARLAERCTISFCIDTLEAARAASRVLADAATDVEVLLEVDTGHRRCGVDPRGRESVALAKSIDELPGLSLAGILTHAGHGYFGPGEGETCEDALVRVSVEERDLMLQFAARLREAGIRSATSGSLEISVGSTPTMAVFENAMRDGFTVTEIRPGNYVVNDAIQVSLGAARLQDCAMTVLSAVISRHRDRSGQDRVFLDAGKKVLTSDQGKLTDGFGTILFNTSTMTALPHAQIVSLSEEHGWVHVPGGSTLEIGSTIRIVPNHACVVANMVDKMYLVDSGRVVDELPVDARGCVV